MMHIDKYANPCSPLGFFVTTPSPNIGAALYNIPHVGLRMPCFMVFILVITHSEYV